AWRERADVCDHALMARASSAYGVLSSSCLHPPVLHARRIQGLKRVVVRITLGAPALENIVAGWYGHTHWAGIGGSIMTQLLISAVGPDRPGIVGELTGKLHDAGG